MCLSNTLCNDAKNKRMKQIGLLGPHHNMRTTLYFKDDFSALQLSYFIINCFAMKPLLLLFMASFWHSKNYRLYIFESKL